jgi:hypothetical protein
VNDGDQALQLRLSDRRPGPGRQRLAGAPDPARPRAQDVRRLGADLPRRLRRLHPQGRFHGARQGGSSPRLPRRGGGGRGRRELRIRKSMDGHFWVNGELNGHRCASCRQRRDGDQHLAPPRRRPAIEPAAFRCMVETANGIVQAKRAARRAAQGRPIERARPRRPRLRGVRRHERARHELPVVAVGLGRRGAVAGAEEGAAPVSVFYIMYIIGL